MPELYKHQKQALQALITQKKKFLIAGTGLGKTAVSLYWARSTNKKRWLVVTTAAARDSGQWVNECKMWFGEEYYNSLSSFVVISWAALVDWCSKNWLSLDEWAIIYDECHCAKAGISSNRGSAFIQLAKRNHNWVGLTATPGDKWIHFYPYFTAVGLVKNKTAFQRDFCYMNTFRGFPDITGYRNEHVLENWWGALSYSPDDSEVMASMPAETHRTIHFKAPTGYKKMLKTRMKANGELLDNTMALCHALRQLCLTDDKLEWVKDFVQGLGTNCVFFYNYIEDGNRLAQVIYKALGVNPNKRKKSDPRIWMIDGRSHDIPTAETIGPKDIVLAQWNAGSASLNLQFINYWVSVGPCYSYTMSVQARGRIKRIGQAKPMFFYYLYCDDTIEDDVYHCLKEKRDFAENTWLLGKEK